jgi:hypothetical protein
MDGPVLRFDRRFIHLAVPPQSDYFLKVRSQSAGGLSQMEH